MIIGFNWRDGMLWEKRLQRKSSPANHLTPELRAGMSDAGAAYVEKSLHPVSDVHSDGIPTGTEGNIVVATQKTEHTFGFLDKAASPDSNVDVLMWFPPGNNTTAIVAVGPAGTDFRSAFLSSTASPALGEVVVDQYTYGDSIHDSFAFTFGYQVPNTRYFGSETNSSRYTKWRTVASSVTAYFTAPSVANQGALHVYNGPGAPEVLDYCIETPKRIDTFPVAAQPQSEPAVVPFSGGDVYEVVRPTLFRIPFSEAEFTQMTAAPYTTKATEGFYSITRKVDATHPWAKREALTGVVRAGTNTVSGPNDMVFVPGIRQYSSGGGGPGVMTEMIRVSTIPMNLTEMPGSRNETGTPISETSTALVPWLGQYFCGGPKTAFPWLDPSTISSDIAFDSGATHTVAIARGISAQSSFTIKRCLTLEAQVASNSPARQFASRPPPLDTRALIIAAELSRALPLVYAARDNSFATVMKDALKWLGRAAPIAGTIGSVIATGMGAPELAPLLGGAGAAAGAALTGISNTIGPKKAAAKPQPKPKRPALVLQSRRQPLRPGSQANRRKRQGRMT